MPAHESHQAAQIALGWARTLGGVRDPKLQVPWLREQLQKLGAARAADVLTVVLARAEQREERYGELLLRASLALTTPELARLKRAIARCAEARHQLALARFLGLGTEPEADEPDAEPGDDDRGPAPPRALQSGQGRPLSLGERKSLARRRDRSLLARALRDPHPDVVGILLDNPALTELDVVRLGARRPVQPEVLALVFAHPRWIVRYRVRLTLALNPHTPEALALQLLPHLTATDLRAVARSADLSARVREACEAPPHRSIH